MTNFSPALFKTVREIALERKVADLEGSSTAPSTATPRASIYDRGR